MAILKEVEDYEKQVLKSLGLEYKGLRWCELGDQNIYKLGSHGIYVNVLAKDIYLSRGVEHISLDIHGKNRSLPLELDKPIPFVFQNQFDVITNYGTIEHVNDQYAVFKNVHDMCKTGGIVINTLPLTGHWPEHCRYYYTEVFLKGLAKVCNYKIINYSVLDKNGYAAPFNMIAFTYMKKEDTNNKFISREEFDKIAGITDTGNLEFTGDYTNKMNKDYNAVVSLIKKLPSPIRKIGKQIIRKLSHS